MASYDKHILESFIKFRSAVSEKLLFRTGDGRTDSQHEHILFILKMLMNRFVKSIVCLSCIELYYLFYHILFCFLSWRTG